MNLIKPEYNPKIICTKDKKLYLFDKIKGNKNNKDILYVVDSINNQEKRYAIVSNIKIFSEFSNTRNKGQLEKLSKSVI